MSPADVARHLLTAFNAHDIDGMRALLSADLVAWVTGADGSAHQVVGPDAYLARVEAMDLPAAQYAVVATQPAIAIDDRLVLVLGEIRAARGGRTLENYAAHVFRVDDLLVSEWWMADAKPAESDRFWSDA